MYWLIMAFAIQLILGKVNALTEQAVEGSSAFFRSGSMIIRNGISGSQNTSITCTFSSAFSSQAPCMAFALKKYEGNFMNYFQVETT
jgi:hypothetical protein